MLNRGEFKVASGLWAYQRRIHAQKCKAGETGAPKKAGKAQKGGLEAVQGRADMKGQPMPDPVSKLPVREIS